MGRMISASEQLVLVPLVLYLSGLLSWRLTLTEPADIDVTRIRKFLDSVNKDGFVASVDVECADRTKVCRLTMEVVSSDAEFEMCVDSFLKPTFAMIDRMVNILFGYYAGVMKQQDDLENALEGVFGTSKFSIEPRSRSIYLIPDYPKRLQVTAKYVSKSTSN